MDTKTDIIELVLPFKAEYVSIVRLTASGVANRLGFDIETIEDIKVAVAEVCNKLVCTKNKTAESYRVIFQISGQKLKITFDSKDKSLKCIFNSGDEELGVSIINALMDEVEFCTDQYILSMSKAVEGNI